MKTKLSKFYLLASILSAGIFIYAGCGSDSTTPVTPTTYPTITMTSNSVYKFTNDSLDQSGASHHTTILTKDIFLAQTTIAGKTCFPINDIAFDTLNGIMVRADTIYLSYDASAGKFYQYGVIKMIDSTKPPTWDLVADFSVAAGTPWTIVTNDSIIYHGVHLTTTITAKVAETTTFPTTANPPVTISCYRIEIAAAIFAIGQPFGTVYFDYYLGYASTASNPSGIVRLKLRPVNLSGIVMSDGFDRILQTFIIAP
jgi:hypothetical protein